MIGLTTEFIETTQVDGIIKRLPTIVLQHKESIIAVLQQVQMKLLKLGIMIVMGVTLLMCAL